MILRAESRTGSPVHLLGKAHHSSQSFTAEGFDGDRHSTLDCCRNVTKLENKLIVAGCALTCYMIQ